MGIFGNIFDGHGAADEYEDTIREQQANAHLKTGEHQRQRREAKTNIEVELYNQLITNKRTRRELEETKEELDTSKKLATNIVMERDAMFYTIKYLAEKWGKPITNSEIHEIRAKEKEKLEKTGHTQKAKDYVEQDIKYEMAQSKKAKNKKMSP